MVVWKCNNWLSVLWYFHHAVYIGWIIFRATAVTGCHQRAERIGIGQAPGGRALLQPAYKKACQECVSAANGICYFHRLPFLVIKSPVYISHAAFATQGDDYRRDVKTCGQSLYLVFMS